MDKEDRDLLVRIDERLGKMVDLFEQHVEQDRADFKEIHSRINSLSGKQNWILGGVSGLGVIAGLLLSWAKTALASVKDSIGG